MCELSKDCGFHKLLILRGLIEENEKCPKKVPARCPRYRVATGAVDTKVVMTQFSLPSDPYAFSSPINADERQLANF